MQRRLLIWAGVLSIASSVLAAGAAGQTPAPRTAAPVRPEDLPAKKRPSVPKNVKNWTPPRTAWGDPEIAGVFTNSDESGIPFERPAQFEGRRVEDVTAAELAEIVRQRQQQAVERAPTLSEFPGATSPMHWFENYNAANSRAWLVSDPPDGKVPPVTAEGQARAAARALARSARGPADSWEDRSYYDRCITRGIPGSMMPAIYGNSYQIHQGPGYVAIRYEMVNETRVIPLDGRPHLSEKIRKYLGDAPRPLGRQHAGRRDDELHRQDAVPRLERALEDDRTLQAGRARHGRMVGDVRRPAHVGQALDLRDEPDQGGRQPAAVRVRVPRGQLRIDEHPRAARAGSGGEEQATKWIKRVTRGRNR